MCHNNISPCLTCVHGLKHFESGSEELTIPMCRLTGKVEGTDECRYDSYKKRESRRDNTRPEGPTLAEWLRSKVKRKGTNPDAK